jgi:DUF2075 family protein
VIKLKKVRWTGHVESIDEIGSVYKKLLEGFGVDGKIT